LIYHADSIRRMPGSGCMVAWFSSEGSPFPPGQTWNESDGSYNFSLYSRHASTVTLLLYKANSCTTPLRTVPINPITNKFGNIWFCKVPKSFAADALYYAYRVDGPAGARHRFDREKILLDPYAKGVFFPPEFDRRLAESPGPNDGKAPLGILSTVDPHFDWKDDRRPVHDADTILYEMHIKGFTRDPSSGVTRAEAGTYRGVIDKIPHLKALGVTAVELMPVHQFDPQENNYWGYMPLNFFSPHQAFAVDPLHTKREFREMVQALHAADIEVILDVVFNHTVEGDQVGPIYSFKGIDNSSYYITTGNAAAPYHNFSGTGNTLQTADPYVHAFVLDSLRYWVTEMRVDGFRFDLASVFSRASDGSIITTDPPLFTALKSDPVLRNVHLIAEPWDAAGLYQLGTSFPGRYWQQWNGKFRDDIRRFVRGDAGLVPSLMVRLYGSDDLFPDHPAFSCRPFQSINYLTSHDGMSLYDLCTYRHKRNEANGHHNTDGPDEEFGWNCGHEGENETPPAVQQLRRQQVKNFFALLMLSNGIPMLRMGDEFMATQHGNSNPYNQDNSTTWLNWDLLKTNADIFRFAREMIGFRKRHPSICRSTFWRHDVTWYGTGKHVDMGGDSHTLAYHLRGASQNDVDLYVMINAYDHPLLFTPQVDGVWRRAVDTSCPSPLDIAEAGKEPVVEKESLVVQARSIVVLIGA
jgi:isoamylase